MRLLVSILFAFALTACGSEENSSSPPPKSDPVPPKVDDPVAPTESSGDEPQHEETAAEETPNQSEKPTEVPKTAAEIALGSLTSLKAGDPDTIADTVSDPNLLCETGWSGSTVRGYVPVDMASGPWMTHCKYARTYEDGSKLLVEAWSADGKVVLVKAAPQAKGDNEALGPISAKQFTVNVEWDAPVDGNWRLVQVPVGFRMSDECQYDVNHPGYASTQFDCILDQQAWNDAHP